MLITIMLDSYLSLITMKILAKTNITTSSTQIVAIITITLGAIGKEDTYSNSSKRSSRITF